MYESPTAVSTYDDPGTSPLGLWSTYQNVYPTKQAVWDAAVAAWHVAAATAGVAAVVVLYV